MIATPHNRILMTESHFLGGKIRLHQSESGHRSGTDAVLLAATVDPSFTGTLIDAGSASGAVGLSVVARVYGAHLRCIEIDAIEAELARANILANGFQERASVIEADLMAEFKVRESMGMTRGDADRVLTNPPFLAEGKTRASPDLARQRAHTMPEDGLSRWIVACHAMLKPHGALTLIHRVDALPEILDAMSGRFGRVGILPIHSRAGAPATRVIIEGIKGSRAPLALLSGLILHETDGKFTAFADALHKGEATLSLQH
jgi:tRNA1(Val) A37 N6-methylase TrmN6